MSYFDWKKIESVIEKRFGTSQSVKASLYEGLLNELMSTMTDELSVSSKDSLEVKIKGAMKRASSHSQKLSLFFAALTETLQQYPEILEKFSDRANQYITNTYVLAVRAGRGQSL